MGHLRDMTNRARRTPIRPVAVLLGLVLAVSLSVAACGTTDHTATGVVIALDSSAGQVRSFTLRTSDGQTIPFVIGTLVPDADAFPAAHLSEHAATLGPIVVSYRVEGGKNVADRLVDAPGASPS